MAGYDYSVEDYPVPRFGTPDDVAEAVAYLASPAAAYVTGECLKVTGGVGM
jgi:3-oxoacyl-[acyl-carrier protein] reductase